MMTKKQYFEYDVYAPNGTPGAQNKAVEVTELTQDRIIYRLWDPIMPGGITHSASYASFARQFPTEIDTTQLY